MHQVAGAVAAVVGAAIGYVGWLALMWVFATVCGGMLGFAFCGPAGGPNMLDLLTLPVLVIGGGLVAYGLASGAVQDARTRR
jgi:hypothetical protein